MRNDDAELKINGDRLWASLMTMARTGATAKGGICRAVLTGLDRDGRDLFVNWCNEAGCSVRLDPTGNIVARRSGRNNNLAPVSVGSQLNTHPTGGRMDGICGALAGLEVIRTLNDLGIETERPIEVFVEMILGPPIVGISDREIEDPKWQWIEARGNLLLQAMLAKANELPVIGLNPETIAWA